MPSLQKMTSNAPSWPLASSTIGHTLAYWATWALKCHGDRNDLRDVGGETENA